MATRYEEDARFRRPRRLVRERTLRVDGVHTEKTVSLESFASRVVRVLLERRADIMCLVVDLYRRRR